MKPLIAGWLEDSRTNELRNERKCRRQRSARCKSGSALTEGRQVCVLGAGSTGVVGRKRAARGATHLTLDMKS